MYIRAQTHLPFVTKLITLEDSHGVRPYIVFVFEAV